MTSITNYYGIRGTVPFIDVHVDADNRLFLDPHAIRLTHSPDPFASSAISCIDSYLGEIVRCVVADTPSATRRGELLLQQFGEPWETRLGMSATGYLGHGGASEIGSSIWHALKDDLRALIQIGILKHLEELPLFVRGVDRDITSDLTTRIVFEPLGRFTERMLDTYPEFRAGDHETIPLVRQVWNPTAGNWDLSSFELPVADGRPLLLVPNRWARSQLLMSATRYYETAVLGFAQTEQTVVVDEGKLLKTPKRVLRQQPGLERGRVTNIRLTMRAITRDANLIADFERFVADRFDTKHTTGEAA